MSKSFSQVSDQTTNLRHSLPAGVLQETTTVYPDDLRHPGKSVYGFPLTAARLAADQVAIMSCREDEVFDTIGRLNDLLGSREHLNQAYRLLQRLAEEQQKKLAQLLDLSEQPLNKNEIPDLIARVEESLHNPAAQTVSDRLDSILSPAGPTQEIAGLGKMVSRLQSVMVALNKVKDRGFKVVVVDRRRQLKRPAAVAGPSSAALVEYHLTLWTYRLVRSDQGQSAIWN